MFKGLGNLGSMMKQAQEMQGRMKEVQQRLESMRVQGSAGGGMVTVECSGQQKILSCRIDPVLVQSGDAEMIEELTVAAVNQALDKAKETAAEEMGRVAGDMNIPGLEDAMSKLGIGG